MISDLTWVMEKMNIIIKMIVTYAGKLNILIALTINKIGNPIFIESYYKW